MILEIEKMENNIKNIHYDFTFPDDGIEDFVKCVKKCPPMGIIITEDGTPIFGTSFQWGNKYKIKPENYREIFVPFVTDSSIYGQMPPSSIVDIRLLYCSEKFELVVSFDRTVIKNFITYGVRSDDEKHITDTLNKIKKDILRIIGVSEMEEK